jgi:putative FmdB family regulatory protein
MEYEHACKNPECNHQWIDEYSMKDDPPTECPACHQQTAKRLISGGSGKGIVELSGNDLVAKVKSDAVQMQREAATNEKQYANLLGEARYHDMQSRLDRAKRRG